MLKKELVIIFLMTSIFYIFFQSLSIFGGDAGDLVTAICTGGIPHPQGYPLYTILGRIVNLLPFYTPAWRVSLLSSIPASGVVTLVCWLIFQLTKSRMAGIIGAYSLGFSYLFWLYASVPELFSLNNLFFIILIILGYLFINSKKINTRLLLVISFVSGLAVSHHYFLLWAVAILGIFILKELRVKKFPFRFRFFFKNLFAFLAGFLPYIYVPLAARNDPIVSWENAVNLKNFLYLITRRSYGGFATQSIAYDSDIEKRFELVVYGFQLIHLVFGNLGLILILFGFLFLFLNKRKLFYYFIFLYSGSLISLFYIGFSLYGDDLFALGIFSRFTLLAMVLSGVFIGLGSYYLVILLKRLLPRRLFLNLVFSVFLLLPFAFLVKNYPKIYAIKYDLTAENYGRDILATAEKNGTIFLVEDNTVFNTWYVRYCLNEFSDINVITTFPLDETRFKKHYPNLIIPKDFEDPAELISANAASSAVYANDPGFAPSASAVPIGLLWRNYATKEKIPSTKELIDLNLKVINKYHNPYEGILKWFQPVTLADVLRSYSYSSKNFARLLYLDKQYEESILYLKKAIELYSKDPESYYLLGQIYSANRQCKEAESIYLSIIKNYPSQPEAYDYLLKNASECFKDKAKEDFYQNLYNESKRTFEKSIKELSY